MNITIDKIDLISTTKSWTVRYDIDNYYYGQEHILEILEEWDNHIKGMEMENDMLNDYYSLCIIDEGSYIIQLENHHYFIKIG